MTSTGEKIKCMQRGDHKISRRECVTAVKTIKFTGNLRLKRHEGCLWIIKERKDKREKEKDEEESLERKKAGREVTCGEWKRKKEVNRNRWR